MGAIAIAIAFEGRIVRLVTIGVVVVLVDDDAIGIGIGIVVVVADGGAVMAVNTSTTRLVNRDEWRTPPYFFAWAVCEPVV